MNTIYVVYDVDDVLNNLCEYVHEQVGTDKSNQKYFSLRECKGIYTDEQIESIQGLFADEETFKHLSYNKGASDIMKYDGDGVEVHIHSNNFTQAIADVKTESLLKNINGLTPDRIHMMVVESSHNKEIFKNATIVIDDNINYLMAYPKNIIRILINKPYNQPSVTKIYDWTEGIVRVPDLETANRLVESFIEMIKDGRYIL